MTRTQYKRRTLAYWISLAIYTIVLAVIILYVWSSAKQYAIEYENSMSSTVVDAFIEQLNEDRWNDGMDVAARKLENEFQSADECVELVQNSLVGPIQCSKIANPDFSKLKYRIVCNDREIGQVVFCEDESQADNVRFGMLPWKLESESYSFDYMINGSATATVPSNYSVTLNGNPVGDKYISETGIKYDVLKDYYDEYPGLPTKVRYDVSGLVGNITPVIYNESGEEITIDPNANDSQFLEPCPEEEVSRLRDFVFVFVPAYARFTGTANFDVSLPELRRFVKPGSTLEKNIYQYYEGGSQWINWTGFTIDSINLNSAYELGGGFYVVDVSYNTTNYHTYKGAINKQVENRVVVVDNGTEILAVSVE